MWPECSGRKTFDAGRGAACVPAPASFERPVARTIDDEYCAAWRTAMLAAGGTERDMDVLAVFLVLLVIADTERGSSERQDLIERIAEHVACTSMVVRIGRGDDCVAVEFPDRPRIH